jgi:hypothetical protein
LLRNVPPTRGNLVTAGSLRVKAYQFYAPRILVD